jgi:iron complex outermembrane recepter protein
MSPSVLAFYVVLFMGLGFSFSAHAASQKIEVFADKIPDLKNRASSMESLQLTNPFKQSSEENLLEVPNLNFAGGTNRPRYLQIRGVGETSTYENTPSHSVTYLIDDIDLTGIIASWPQMNISQWQVDMGPQSTFWGGSSTGGMVRTQLHHPDEESQIRWSGGSQGSFQGGIETNIGTRSKIFLYHNQDPGFYRNTYLNKYGAEQNEYYVSLTNDIFHSPSWNASSTHLGLKTNNAYDVWSLNNNLKTLSDHLGQDAQLVQGHSLKISRRLGNGDSAHNNSINSMSSVAISEGVSSYDADWGNNTYWQSIPGWNKNYDYFDEFARRRTAYHQKLFWERDSLARSTILGVHMYGLNERTHIDHFKNNTLKSALGSHFSSHSVALYGDWRENFSNSQWLQLAIRYEYQKMDYDDSNQIVGARQDRFFSFQTQWRQNFYENYFLFAKVSSGFKNAGVNIDNTLPVDLRYYSPEKVMNYELGFEYRNTTHRLSATVFHMDQRQKQVKVSKQDDPTDPSSFSYFTSNAAHVATTGLEARLQERLDRWELEAQIGLLNAAFRKYEFENQSYDGRRVAHAPSWNYALSLTRSWSKSLSSNFTLIGKNSFYFSNNHNQRSTTTHLLNFGTHWVQGNWAWSLWVKNLLDNKYETRGFYFANEPPNWENKLYVQQGLPRMAGVAVTYTF